MPCTPDQMYDAIMANLPAKTGRTEAQWLDLLRADGPATFKERAAWLKTTHGLGGVTANLLARALDKPADHAPATDAELISRQYAGPKAHLRPICDRLVAAALALGDDVEIGPRETMVSLVRRKQFATIHAANKSQVDLILLLPGVPFTERMRPAGSLGDERRTHRITLKAPEEVDAEAVEHLRAAYNRAAPVQR